MTENHKRSPRQRSSGVSEQSRRFIRTARELGCDEDPEKFEQVFARVVPPRTPPEPASDNAASRPSRRSAAKRRSE